MLIKIPPRWALPERAVTPESTVRSRREFLRAAGFASGLALGPPWLPGIADGIPPRQRPDWLRVPDWPAADLYPFARNVTYAPEAAGRPVSDEGAAASYNNFYELTPRKERVRHRAERFEMRPWTLQVDGLVDRPAVLDVDELIRRMPVEERVYRHRCVEAWSMVVPWSGFPMRDLLRIVEPRAEASFVRFETAHRPDQMPGIREQPHYPWPYVEGLHIHEARNDLTFLACGIYGHPLPKQHGGPLRLVTPWKYGFKSVKSIARITFVSEQPATFWNVAVPREYGFWACVHPEHPHPRWSQALERPIPDGDPIPTLPFNGYDAEVAHLYRAMEGRLAYY